MSTYHVRRSDREIRDAAEIEAILAQGEFVTIALARQDEPYIVTMSYGYDAERRALYFHAATEGLKYDFMATNPSVCATVILDGGYVPGKCEHHYTSVVMRGALSRVTDAEEMRYGMRVLLGHLESDAEEWMSARKLDDPSAYERMAVLKLEILEVTAKRGK